MTSKRKKRIGATVDILMYSLLTVQMLYVIIGNNGHEILGIVFFICLIIHVVLKKWWFKSVFRKEKDNHHKLFDLITGILIISVITLIFSSMGVSRFIFPWFHILGSPVFHRYLATIVLTLSVLHGGLKGIRTAKKKNTAWILVILACICSCSMGLFAVPYLNRHLRTVDIDYSEKVHGAQVEWSGNKPLVVYFTRLGNTDFEPDVDAVSGASLLISEGEMMGSNRLLADMVCDILDCKSAAITLTEKRYPSSYNDTVSVAGEELRKQARPEIEPINISGYDSIILIYPLWWGSIPMPVATFLEQNDFNGKTVYLIATQGSSGYGSTVSEIEALCPGAAIIPGTSIYCEDIPDARDDLLKLINNWIRQ